MSELEHTEKFKQLTSYKLLSQAFDEAVKGKPYKKKRLTKKEYYLNQIIYLLKSRTWTPFYTMIKIKQDHNKKREMRNSAFIDKVIGRALIMLYEDYWKKRISFHAYQSIKGRGIHLANKRKIEYVNKTDRNIPLFFLHVDIKKFYQSIDKHLCLENLKKYVKEWDILEIFEKILAPHGVVLGGVTSQWFANLFLNDLDTIILSFVKKIKGFYMRYADDIVIIANIQTTTKLCQLRDIIVAELHKLKLKTSKININRIDKKNCLNSLGILLYR